MIDDAPLVKGLTDAEQADLRDLWKVWRDKAVKNELLDAYYDQHRVFKDLGISIPPQLANSRAVLDWPQKAVRALSRKHVFEGYSLDGAGDPFELGEILERNSFTLELPQAITAAYRHGVAFLTVTAGDETRGEPPVMIQARDALWSSGLWDQRRRCLRAVMAVTDADKDKTPREVVLYLIHDTIRLSRGAGAWTMERLGNWAGRVMVEPLVYDPQIGRPFGHSRITRTVRYLTDSAVRTMVRTETSAEFYSAPQRYVLGASEGAFANKDRWTAVTGRVLALEPNENGDIPQVGTFPQLTMAPHLEMYRQLAQNFCSATNLPQSSVGIYADNPASAEAMQAAEYALSDEAEYQWRIFEAPLRRVMQDAVMVRDHLEAPPAESWRLAINWTPARYVSPQAASDYIVKTVQALPRVADTTVALRRAGFTQQEIDQMEAEWRKAGAAQTVREALSASRERREVAADGVDGGGAGASGAEQRTGEPGD